MRKGEGRDVDGVTQIVWTTPTERSGDQCGSAQMFQFYADDHERFTGDRDLAKVRELNPALQSFGDWVGKHKDQLKTPQS